MSGSLRVNHGRCGGGGWLARTTTQRQQIHLHPRIHVTHVQRQSRNNNNCVIILHNSCYCCRRLSQTSLLPPDRTTLHSASSPVTFCYLKDVSQSSNTVQNKNCRPLRLDRRYHYKNSIREAERARKGGSKVTAKPRSRPRATKYKTVRPQQHITAITTHLSCL